MKINLTPQTTPVDGVQVDAQFLAVMEQRNAAMNQVVNLSGTIAALRRDLAARDKLIAEQVEKVEELEVRVLELTPPEVTDTVATAQDDLQP